MKAIMMVVIGFIFGLGLIISGMTNPAKVINFLTYGNQWDGSLIIVMAVAMLIMMLTWLWVAKKEKPLISGTFNLSNLKNIDARLIIGSVLFGLGWGLSGICPGPGLVQLVSLKMEFLLFFAAVLGGMWLAKKV
ncbi:YeeE/YedE family protein [Pseudoalteromonas sp. Hal273]